MQMNNKHIIYGVLRHTWLRAWLCSFLLLMAVVTAHASDKGKWNLYLSYNQISDIVPMGSKTFVLASNGLFSYRVQDGDLVTYSKVNVLSDAGINHIAWSKSAQQLVITYVNGNIDLLSEKGDVINIPDFYLKSLSDSKTINHIYIQGSEAYLSTSFGVIKLDVAQATIQDTYRLDFNVDYSYLKEGYIYAASSQRGIYRGALTDNLLDKSNWKRVSDYVYPSEDHKNVYDATNKYWWTTTANGKLTYYTVDAEGNRSYKTEGILPEGPASNNFYKLYMHNNVLYAVAGKWAQELDGGRIGEVHVWDGNVWTEFEQPTKEQTGVRYVDVNCLDFDPNREGHVMVGAKSGLYEFQDGKFVKLYNRTNSPLRSCNNVDEYHLITGLKYDKNGILWIGNSTADTDADFPIRSFSQSIAQWDSFTHTEMNGNYNADMINFMNVSYDNRLWFVNNWYESNKLYAYNTQTDELTNYGPNFVNEDGVSLKPVNVYCATEDKYGNIWLGTSSGPIYLSKENVQNGAIVFVQHKVPRNDGSNYADYLLADVPIRSIAVDAGNRKWMGTSSDGIYVISDDCNEQIAHFTKENSPLLSNMVEDIYITPKGLVYVATDGGLCSYQSDVTETFEEMTKENVYAYPNPVNPDYNGDIHIVGLTYDADVKIVSVNGSLINQGRSIGGSYTWNGCDLKGNKVVSGIYMVETATASGDKGVVCKIAIIR